MSEHSLEADTLSFALLAEVRHALAAALDSLDKHLGMHDLYVAHGAKYINRAIEGFMFLRDGGRVDASKLLVRPAIEVVFRIEAVRRTPELLYRIAYTERLEDRKWIEPALLIEGKAYDATADQQRWLGFTARYKAKFPNHSLSERKFTVWDAAEAAQMSGYFNSHYRTYCQHTHGAYRAMRDDLNDLTDSEDNRVMTLCAFTALNASVSLGAICPKMQSLHERVMAAATPHESASGCESN